MCSPSGDEIHAQRWASEIRAGSIYVWGQPTYFGGSI